MSEKITCYKCKHKTELIQDKEYPALFHCKLCGWDYVETDLKDVIKEGP